MYYPHTAFLVLTTQCNRRRVCEHCFYNMETDRLVSGVPSTSQVLDVLQRLRMAGISHVIFTGGEPTLRLDLPELVHAARDMGQTVLLLTNGTRMTPELAEQLEQAGLSAVSISIVEMDSTERRAVELLRYNTAMPVSLIFCFSKKTFKRIPDAVKFAAGHKTPLLIQPAYVPKGHRREKDLSMRRVDPFQWSEVYTMLRPWAKHAGCESYLKRMYNLYQGEPARPPRCVMSGHAVVIDADMHLLPCFHRRDLDCGSAPGSDFSLALANWNRAVPRILNAPCFGEHCLSLHMDVD